jgi:streptogramin lyase
VNTGCSHGGIAAGFNRVWVGDGRTNVYVLNPVSRTFTRIPGNVPAHAVAVGNDRVYTSDATHLASIDPSSLRAKTFLLIRNSTAGHPTLGIDATTDALWVVSPDHGTVCKCDPNALAPIQQILFTNTLDSVVTGDGSVWVTVEGRGTLLQLDPFTVRQLHTVPLGHAPTGIAFADGKLWVTIQQNSLNQL